MPAASAAAPLSFSVPAEQLFVGLLGSRAFLTLPLFLLLVSLPHPSSYRPNVTVAFVQDQLAFADAAKCVEWLTGIEGMAYVESGSGCTTTLPTATALIDCKNSTAAIASL